MPGVGTRGVVMRSCREGGGRGSGASFCALSMTQCADYACAEDSEGAAVLCAHDRRSGALTGLSLDPPPVLRRRHPSSRSPVMLLEDARLEAAWRQPGVRGVRGQAFAS